MSAPEDSGWIAVVGWDELTHRDTQRGGGALPWLRTYTRLMRDDGYMELSEHCALILHRLWLEYASSSARLRADTRSLSRRLGLRVTKSHLESLNHAGFIVVCASIEQAKGWHAASVHDVRDRDRERDKRRFAVEASGGSEPLDEHEEQHPDLSLNGEDPAAVEAEQLARARARIQGEIPF